MTRYLWNRFTLWGTIGILAGISCLLIYLATNKGNHSSQLVIFPAIGFIILGLTSEVTAFYKSRHFSRQDALAVYLKVINLIKELRELGRRIHKDIDHLPDPNRAFRQDKRLRDLRSRFNHVKDTCFDYKLQAKLDQVFDVEQRMAKLRFDPLKFKWENSLEGDDGYIRNYIDTQLKVDV